MSSALLSQMPPPSPSSALRSTNPNFAPREIIREDIRSAPLLLHQGPSYPPPDDDEEWKKSGDHRGDVVRRYTQVGRCDLGQGVFRL
jgi:hypothetical protein